MTVNKDKTITIKQTTGVNISLALLVMAVGALVTFTTFISDIKNRSIDNRNEIINIKAEMEKVKADANDSKIRLTEIQTQLKSIDTTLLEIKARLN